MGIRREGKGFSQADFAIGSSCELAVLTNRKLLGLKVVSGASYISTTIDNGLFLLEKFTCNFANVRLNLMTAITVVQLIIQNVESINKISLLKMLCSRKLSC